MNVANERRKSAKIKKRLSVARTAKRKMIWKKATPGKSKAKGRKPSQRCLLKTLISTHRSFSRS